MFKGLGHYAEWPKVADVVIKAHNPIASSTIKKGDRVCFPSSTAENVPVFRADKHVHIVYALNEKRTHTKETHCADA